MRVPKHGPQVFVLLDLNQDYEESTRLLAVSGSLQASKLTARRLRRTRRPIMPGSTYLVPIVTSDRTLTIELRTADVVLRRWNQEGVGLYRPQIGQWKCDPQPTPETPERLTP